MRVHRISRVQVYHCLNASITIFIIAAWRMGDEDIVRTNAAYNAASAFRISQTVTAQLCWLSNTPRPREHELLLLGEDS